jgi:hypothetical protein
VAGGEKNKNKGPSINRIMFRFAHQKTHKMMKPIALLPLIFISLQALAQLSFEKRLEIDLKDDDFKNHEVFEFGENGFIIRAEGKKSMQGQDIRYSLYDNNIDLRKELNELLFIKKSSKHLRLSNKDKIIECVYEMNGNLQVVMVSSDGSAVNKLQLKAPKGMKSMRGVCTENYAVLLFGSTKSIELISIKIDNGQVEKKEIKIKDFKASQIRLNTISVTNQLDDIIISYEIKATSKQRTTNPNLFQDYLVSYNCTKNHYDVISFYHKDAKNILELNAAKTGENSYAISGSYNNRTGTAVGTSFGEGIFFATIENGKVTNYTDKSYGQFEEFFKHLPQRVQNKIEKKKRKKEDRGKELKFTSWCVFHGLVVSENGYYCLSEHYHPTYVTYTTTDANGRTTTHRVFDGYQYTHATLVKFSKSGEFLWDRSFTMYPINKPFHIKRFITSKFSNQEFSMVFSDGNRINSKSFNENGVIKSEASSDPIPTSFDGDRTKVSSSDIVQWYDNYFLAYGISTIKNKDGDKTKRKRRVFFVSKVKFE